MTNERKAKLAAIAGVLISGSVVASDFFFYSSRWSPTLHAIMFGWTTAIALVVFRGPWWR